MPGLLRPVATPNGLARLATAVRVVIGMNTDKDLPYAWQGRGLLEWMIASDVGVLQLAQCLHVSRQAVSAWVIGKSRPDAETVQILHAAGCNVHWVKPEHTVGMLESIEALRLALAPDGA